MPGVMVLRQSRPGHSTPFFLIIGRLRGHWKAHHGKYPQRVLLTPPQHQDMNDWHHLPPNWRDGQVRHPKAVAGEKFMEVLIGHNPNTPGVMDDVNGVQIPPQAPPAAGA